jgi:hypothetical protein
MHFDPYFFEAQNIFVTCAPFLHFEATSIFLVGVQIKDVT